RIWDVGYQQPELAQSRLQLTLAWLKLFERRRHFAAPHNSLLARRPVCAGLANCLVQPILLGAEILRRAARLTQLSVDGQQRVHVHRRVAPPRHLFDQVRVLANECQIQHGKPPETSKQHVSTRKSTVHPKGRTALASVVPPSFAISSTARAEPMVSSIAR